LSDVIEFINSLPKQNESTGEEKEIMKEKEEKESRQK
jgi:hypothetical protein